MHHKYGLAAVIVSIVLYAVITVYVNFMPAKSAPGEEKYAEAVKKIDELAGKEIDTHHIPGMSIALVDDTGIIWSKDYGYRDVKNKVRTGLQTLYRIGSDTKPMTAVAVMMLAERGLVDLDAPVETYIPGFSVKSRFAGTAAGPTVRQLLSHHSGLRRDIYKDYEGVDPSPLHSIVDELKTDYLVLPPGTRYLYSNIGYSLLGMIIESASGKSYEQFIHDELLAPLGMHNTYTSLKGMVPDIMPKGYRLDGKLLVKIKETGIVQGRDTPAGSVVSSAEDMAKFLQFILNGGRGADGRRLIGSVQLEEMFTVQYPENELDEEPYGLGWKVGKAFIPGAGPCIEHGGTQPGFQSLLAALPHEKLGVVVLYNTNQVISRHYIANRALALLLEDKNKSGAEGAEGRNGLQANSSRQHGNAGRTQENSGRPQESSSGAKANAEELVKDSLAGFAGRYVAGTDSPMIVDIGFKGTKPWISLQGQKLSLVRKPGGKFKLVKDLLILKLGIGRFVGYDDVLLDFVTLKDGTVYPRLVFAYRDLNMTMLLEKIQPYELTKALRELEGRYLLAEESKKHVYGSSFSSLDIAVEGSYLEVQVKIDESSHTAVLIPAGINEFTIAGTGETVRLEGNRIAYSGLFFDREVK